MSKTDIRSLSLSELTEKTVSMGLPKYRAGQIYSWLNEKGAVSFDDMTNIGKQLRKTLDDEFYICNCKIDTKLVSQKDDTVKYLFDLSDGEYVESVVMKYKYGYTICISTQLGCKMGCSFCASAIGGFKRHLRPSEMLSEVNDA